MRRAPSAIHYSARTNSLSMKTLSFSRTLLLLFITSCWFYICLFEFAALFGWAYVRVNVCWWSSSVLLYYVVVLLFLCSSVCLSGWYCHLAAAQRAPLLAWLTPPFARVLTIIICCCASRSLVHDFVVCAEVGCAVLLRLCCSR